MFNPDQRIYAPKEFIWEQVKRGELMNLSFDLETSGFTRHDVPYATPNYPFITEYGDALTDLSGNYLNSAQIFARRPDWLMFQPGAAILQRMQKMDENLFDSEDRQAIWLAMAQIAWRLEQSAYDYDKIAQALGDVPEQASFVHHYKTNKGMKTRGITEKVYPVPLKDENGEIVHDVRYHPDRRKISYKISDDPNSKYNEHCENLYYIDNEDGSKWKWIDPALANDGFNVKGYDIPILRANLHRFGFTPSNSTFLYARGTATSKQKKKNHVIDVRDLAFWTALAGPQGEDGLKIGEIVDPVTGKIRSSEALGIYHDANKGQANPIRLLRPGLFNIDDHSYFDESMAHGAVIDAIGTAALRNKCWEIAPWIAGEIIKQADKKKLFSTMIELPNKNSDEDLDDDDKLQLYSLPERDGGYTYGEKPHYFVGPDDQMGRFGNLIFLLADGSLHKKKFKSTPVNELSVDQWIQFLNSREGRGVVRSIHFNKWKGALHIDDVLQKSSMAGEYIKNISNLKKDTAFIIENDEMMERLKEAIDLKNRSMRFNSHEPQVPLIEDELPAQFSGEVHYQDEAVAIERRLRGQNDKSIPGVLESLKTTAQNIYEYMRSSDEALGDFALKPHMIDYYHNADMYKTEAQRFKELQEQSKSDEGIQKDIEKLKKTIKTETRFLKNFEDLCERNYKKAKKKKWPMKKFLDELMNPATNLPYFIKGKFVVNNIAQAVHFRKLVAQRIFADYETELNRSSQYAKGLIDKNYNHAQAVLFSDVDNGEKGAAPHVIDKQGREIDISYIKRQDPKDVYELLAKDDWKIRFYRLRNPAGLLRLMQRYVDLGMRDQIPEKLVKIYEADKQRRFHGMPNEDRTTSRIPTLETFRYELDRLQLNAKSYLPLILERDAHPQMGEALNAVKYDEGQQILKLCEDWWKTQVKQQTKKPELFAIASHHAKSNLPLDHIRYEINRDSSKELLNDKKNLIILDVPIWHMRHPKEQNDIRLPSKILAVKDVSGSCKASVNLNNKNIILREEETGRLYYPGPTSIQAMPLSSDKRFSIIREGIFQDYRSAGYDPETLKFSLVGIENLYPVAFSRQVDPHHQSFKLPHLQFESLTAPEYAHMGKVPLTTAIIPVDYCPQKLTPGKPLRLREMAANLFANIDGGSGLDTGQTYETTLRHVIGLNDNGDKEGITLRELFQKAKSGDIPSNIIKGAGFMNADHIESRLREWVTMKWRGHPMDQKVLIATFDQVNKAYIDSGRDESKNTWALFNMLSAPKAAFKYDNQPIPPHVYMSL